jgi:small-conductance mechanosensitive channel
MSSPAFENLDKYKFPAFDSGSTQTPSSDEDGTLRDDTRDEHIDKNFLHLQTSYTSGDDGSYNKYGGYRRDLSPMSPAQQREQSQRLDDELEMLRAERVATAARTSSDSIRGTITGSMHRSRSLAHGRSRTNIEPEDDFDIGTTPVHEQAKIYSPPTRPVTQAAKLFKKIHDSSFLVRYFFYITPVTLLLLIPVLLGGLKYHKEAVGGVDLFWFGIWLEVFWLTLWAGRLIAKSIPYPMGVVSSLFTNDDKLWRDLGKQLQMPLTLFLWWLAIQISFLPTMTNHHLDGNQSAHSWETTTNKIIVSIFVGIILNLVEKILIQLIAVSFHMRTYSDRIEVNKFQLNCLVKLYIYSKENIAMDDSEFEHRPEEPSGVRTPMKYLNKAGRGARQALYKVGDVAGKVAGDFTGREIAQSTHPDQVILQLLSSTSGSQVLARRLYRTFTPDDAETVSSEDLRPAFDTDEESDAAFSMFDKDLNGDISMEELEAVCVEIGRERKAIMASLKDLDSVISKLDNVFIFVIVIITVLVFVSLISTSGVGVLASAGSAVLALSWLFSASAQEFLQSIIFVFVKHPFDVGDRVTIYGNTGQTLTGDDYFVKEISLLFTEFKKMEGHVVQAPNSYLNKLFILNQRRSGGLAEAVPIIIKFGTSLEQIDELRIRLLDFVGSENREYQHNILTELKTVFEAYSITLNVIFFYKSNWQNELLRLQRRNKFICALMVTMQELDIEGPRKNWAGQSSDAPVYTHNFNAPPGSQTFQPPPNTPPGRNDAPLEIHGIGPQPRPSILRTRGSRLRPRGESLAQLSKHVDFSLGMQSISSSCDMGDVFDKPKPRLPRVSRAQADHSDDEYERLNRASSRDSKGSDGTARRRNGFFSRIRGSKAGKEPRREDIETGGAANPAAELHSLDTLTSNHVKGVEQMPEIPEKPSRWQSMAGAEEGMLRPGCQVSPREAARDGSLMGSRSRGVSEAAEESVDLGLLTMGRNPLGIFPEGDECRDGKGKNA